MPSAGEITIIRRICMTCMKKLFKKILCSIPAIFYCWFFNFCYLVISTLAKTIAFAYLNLCSLFKIPWFDHRFDWLRGPENWTWNERGIYGIKLIQTGNKVLDLCCGDGIYSGLFYSMFAKLVHGVDRSDAGIRFAHKYYARKNVKFFKIDIIKENFPSNNYDVIFMFAAIEHFSVAQGKQILQRIAKALFSSSNGCFLGSTPIFNKKTGHGHPEHDNEFTSVKELRNFLSPYFKEIEIWSSKWGLMGERRDTYFLCKKPIVHGNS